MTPRTTTIVEEKAGEALKRAALVLAGTLIIAGATVATALNPFVARFEDHNRGRSR